MEEANEAAWREAHKRLSLELLIHGHLGSVCAALNYGSELIGDWNAAQGFWSSDNTGEKIALMHSELSEALEADRKSAKVGTPVMCDKLGLAHLTAVEEELADVLIRVMDFAGHHKLNLGGALRDKLLFNLTRPYRHGKKY